MKTQRSDASYLAVIVAVVSSLFGCGGGNEPSSGAARVDGCPEIYASGFRNPWRWSFDRQTGDLWVGDVGQGAIEEVNRVVLGGNYGWRCFEGTGDTNLACGNEPKLLPPVAEYGRGVGRSITGGYVYRGAPSGLSGQYVFGDFVTGHIWHIPSDTQPTMVMGSGFASSLSISSFGEGNDGELYVVQFNPGELYRLTWDGSALGLALAFPDLDFIQPLAMLQRPDSDARWYVVGKQGQIWVFDNDPAETVSELFVDISTQVATDSEMGLLGMAFHPDFATNQRVYLSYTTELGGRHSRISEFISTDNGLTLDPTSERILMVVDQPETNHNGGQVAFGPDGYLYIGMGDGGGANDMHGVIGNGQLMTTLLGKMLRIDVNGAQPYGIPPGNPFAGNALCGTP